MLIHVYTMCYNEEILMPYFLRHYGSFAERIFIFDHYSDDRTTEIAENCNKVTVVSAGVKGIHDDVNLINFKNEAYKNSRGKADWVIVADTDEFVYHPSLLTLLEEYKLRGITLPKTSGCDMVADEIPTHSGQIYEFIKCGVPDETFSKRAIFDPSIDIRYFKGAHNCAPSGNIVESESKDIKILHYRFLSTDFILKRMLTRTQRLSPENIKNGWGVIKRAGCATVKDAVLMNYNERRLARIKLI